VEVLVNVVKELQYLLFGDGFDVFEEHGQIYPAKVTVMEDIGNNSNPPFSTNQVVYHF
jgi:hypothetical protein